MKLVWLEFTTYLGSIGAEHWYGDLKCVQLQVGPDKYNTYSRRVERPMDEKEAEYLSKKDGYKWWPGELTSRFNTKDDIVPVAIELFKQDFDPTVDFLVRTIGRNEYDKVTKPNEWSLLAGNEDNFKLVQASSYAERCKYLYARD